MAKRGRKSRYAATTDSIRVQAKPGRLNKQALSSIPEENRDNFATPVKRGNKTFVDDIRPRDTFDYNATQDAEPQLPIVAETGETGLATVELDPLYEAVVEMRVRIQEAEENLQRSREARGILETEMDTVSKLAEEAENELAEAARKAAYLKHEADQVCSEGLVLHQQLSEEEQRWHNMLQEEQQMLAETEQKLRIAEEEAQRISHAKEVAARMNEREMWRLGSSKQGLWLQRRKVQGNALPMSRDKGGNWHMPKMVSSPGATYAQTMLEREQKNQDTYDSGNNERLNMLSQSAQALADRQSSQLEEGFLEQLAAREAERHLAAAVAAQNLVVEPVADEPVAAEPVEVAEEIPEIEDTPPVEETTLPVEETPTPVAEATPVVEEAAPIIVETAPIVVEAAPIIVETPPIVEEAAPIVVETPPIVVEAAPIVVETPPTVAETPPIVVETPPTIVETPPALNEDILRALRAMEGPPPIVHSINPPVEEAPPVEEPPAAQASISPQQADALQILAMRAASYTADGLTGAHNAPSPVVEAPTVVTEAPPPVVEAPTVVAEAPTVAAQPPTVYETPPIPATASEPTPVIPMQEDDIQRLAQQANILARQHLSQQQPQAAPTEQQPVRSIAQKVAEETGRQDHLLKEQQTAEMAIAAAMAAARKAAQSAMAISEQVNQQMPALNSRGLAEEDRPYSVERIIADALSKAAVAEQYRR